MHPYRQVEPRQNGPRWRATFFRRLFVRLFCRRRPCDCHGRVVPLGFFGLYNGRSREVSAWCPRAINHWHFPTPKVRS